MYNNTFQTLYQFNLRAALERLRSKRIPAVIAGILARVIALYFITLVCSLFLGFLNMFRQDGFSESGFVQFISFFMHAVLGLVIVSVVYKNLKIQLGEKNPEFVKNKSLMITSTVIISSIAIVAAFFIGTYYLNEEFGLGFVLKWFIAIGSIFVLYLPYHLLKKTESNYINAFRKTFLQESLPYINKNIQYSSLQSVAQEEFEASKIFTYQTIISYKGSDLFTSSESNFHGSKLKVMQKEVHQSNGKTETKISEVFSGYFFIMDFNKQFSGETFLFPDVSRTVLGEVSAEYLNERFRRPNLQFVQLEDPAFEQMFAVYSTDVVEARYLLSTKLVERITELKNKFYQDISISFINNKLYLAISSEDSLFAPGLFTKIDDEIFLQKQYEFLHALLTIPEHFDLKTKVWG